MHLCIGQAYAFSVFNLPLTKLIGITKSAPDDWKLTELGWIFSIAIVFLGLSAAVFGTWLERVGPRKAMFAAALCFGGGFLVVGARRLACTSSGCSISATACIGGFGLGIGYISPVSTLITWFPDRPGMATGMAIMGFGGGAMIASPLSVLLMEAFSQRRHMSGVAETFVVHGRRSISCFMMFGAVDRAGAARRAGSPAGYVRRRRSRAGSITTDERACRRRRCGRRSSGCCGSCSA